MITIEQAIQAKHGDEVHYGKCWKHVGPKGGIKLHMEIWRVSGKCKTWKTRPNEFRLPIKFGLYSHSHINDGNCKDFHFVSDCPIAKD
jgi:hypothetical protein